MRTVEIPGLGTVSRAMVAKLELCEEAFTETFHLGAVVRAIRAHELTEKEIRKAAHSMVLEGSLENFGPGMYKWTAKGLGQS
jgi:hypothetical protein